MTKQLHDESSRGVILEELYECSERKVQSAVETLATCQAQLDGRMRQLARGESKYNQVVEQVAKLQTHLAVKANSISIVKRILQ